MDEVFFIRIGLGLGAILISLIIHEVSHAYAAYLQGDYTAKALGRLTLNPIKHIDPFFTIILPALLFLATQGRFMFGGARPVPINPLNFRNPSAGLMLTALAGPLSNFGLAILAFLMLFAFYHIDRDLVEPDYAPAYFFMIFIFINLLLATFNLLPIPPLDGSRVLRHFLSYEGRRFLDSIEPFGLIIIMMLIWFTRTWILLLLPFRLLVSYVFPACFGWEYTLRLLEAFFGG